MFALLSSQFQGMKVTGSCLISVGLFYTRLVARVSNIMTGTISDDLNLISPGVPFRPLNCDSLSSAVPSAHLIRSTSLSSGFYNNLLAIWPAIGPDNLCISSKVYDIIQYLINKFFHSLPDWIFCFYNLVSCVFLNLEPLRGDWLTGYFVSGSSVVIAQRFGMEYLPFSSSFSQGVHDSSTERTVRLAEYCNSLLA